MIHMKVKPFLHVNHNVWFLFIVVFLNESRETAWEMYLPLLCHWGWKRRHEWTQDLYFCANNSKKWGPELVKRGPERTQDLYSGLYNEKGRSWVSEKRSRADSGPLFWTLQWKREVLSLWKELLRVSHFLKLLHKKPPLFLHHGEQGGGWWGWQGWGWPGGGIHHQNWNILSIWIYRNNDFLRPLALFTNSGPPFFTVESTIEVLSPLMPSFQDSGPHFFKLLAQK